MALALGFPHPRFFQAVLTSTDILDWLSYASLEPFGAVREDLRAGLMLSSYYSAHKPEGGKILEWFDFLPNAESPRVREELAAEAVDDETLNLQFVRAMEGLNRGRK